MSADTHLRRSESHVCTRCGEDKPLEQFFKHRARLAGKAYAAREAWLCDPCKIAHKRDWRSAPENAERDRVHSRRWKDNNREANRARDRERTQRIKVPCAKCGTPHPPQFELCRSCHSARRLERWEAIQRMWKGGLSMREIAAAIDSTVPTLSVDMARMRRDGWDLPYRYAVENSRRVAA